MWTSATFQIAYCFSLKQLWEFVFQSLNIVVKWYITLSFLSARRYFRTIRSQGVDYLSFWNQMHVCHELQNSTPAINLKFIFSIVFFSNLWIPRFERHFAFRCYTLKDLCLVYENMNKFTGLEVKDRENPQHFLKILVNSNSLWLKNMQPASTDFVLRKNIFNVWDSGNDN